MDKGSLTIKNKWDKYRLLAIPPDADPVQVEECRRAFCWGAASVLEIHLEIGEPDVNEDEWVAIIESLHREVYDFLTEMRSKSTRMTSDRALSRQSNRSRRKSPSIWIRSRSSRLISGRASVLTSSDEVKHC